MTIFEIVPTLFSSLLSNVKTDFSSLKKILLTGESLNSSLCREWFKKFSIPLINAYGPTECSDDITHNLMGDFSEVMSGMAPIGYPLANLHVVIIDENLNLRPQGCTGEIVVYGDGVGKGYLERPDLTAEKFVANPFGRGDRLYRTGDLGRYLQDGNIEFLGRIDNQVKIRGFRIELGEVESAINDCDQVKTSIVLAKDGQLVAYIVLGDLKDLEESYKFKTQQDEEVTLFDGEKAAELLESVRTKISQKLPEYMIPSYFVVLERIPLTPNDKTDGKLLRTLDTGKRLITDEYVAPRNEIERKLCEIWQGVLHLEKVGINDNFFKIGGDSILAIQVTSRAKRQALVFSVKDIFTCQVVARLAEITSIEHAEEFEYVPQLFELSPVRKEVIESQTGGCVIDAYPLSHLQEGFLFQAEYAKDSDAYFVQSVLHLENIKLKLLKEAWNIVANQHDILKAGVLWEPQFRIRRFFWMRTRGLKGWIT